MFIPEINNGIPFTFSVDKYKKTKTGGSSNATWRRVDIEDNCVRKAADIIIEQWETEIKPELNRFSNIQLLNKTVNARLDGSELALKNGGLWFYKMIIAKLAGNPNYEQIYKHILDSYQNWMKQEPSDEVYYNIRIQVTEQLHEKLKDLTPLKNPILI